VTAAPVATTRDAAPSRIPVVVLTGFLGTGKTTLLRRLLAHPALERTAVLINEVGEVGLDHQLVFGAEGRATGDAAKGLRSALLLANGCVCCTVRDDLAVALDDLLVRSAKGELPTFDRVIVETTGLANPVPVIDALGQSPLTAAHYVVSQVVCTVDAVAPADRLARHPEAMAQLVCADDVVVTRIDLAGADDVAAIGARVAQLNPRARIHRAARGDIEPAALLEAPAQLAPPASRPQPGIGALERLGPIGPRFHGTGLHTQTLRFAGPSVWRAALATIEETLARSADEVLRVKGVLRLDDFPEPMVVQYAGGRLSPLEPLPGALAEGDAGWLVIITARPDPASARSPARAPFEPTPKEETR
jgi:G3E family GTPase